MQVKKFEAPTIQEALENIKRELGPEAIILQTKKHKRGFGLMSKASVEVTAAVSERSLQKKEFTEKRLPDTNRASLNKLPAEKQADIIDKYIDKHMDKASRVQDKVEVKSRKITATRYADIHDEGSTGAGSGATAATYAQPRRQAPTPAQTAAPQPQARNLDRGTGVAQASAGTRGMSLEEEVHHLKRMIQEIRTGQETQEARESRGLGAAGGSAQWMQAQGISGSPVLQGAFDQLVINGMDKRYALGLLKKVAFEMGPNANPSSESVQDLLAVEIMESTEVISPLTGIRPGAQPGPVVIALVGPTGVGKTTTVAKMASEALLKRSLKVGLINLDSYKVAAFDQLGTYAKILNVPFRSAATASDLSSALKDFQSLDVVLVDTTGRSQRDPNSLRDMEAILRSVVGIRTHLVLSATTRDNELYDMATRFSTFRPQGIIMSKLDEATLYGSIYNVSQRVKLPLLYFTMGQRVPEDIEEATRERVAALILDL